MEYKGIENTRLNEEIDRYSTIASAIIVIIFGLAGSNDIYTLIKNKTKFASLVYYILALMSFTYSYKQLTYLGLCYKGDKEACFKKNLMFLPSILIVISIIYYRMSGRYGKMKDLQNRIKKSRSRKKAQ